MVGGSSTPAGALFPVMGYVPGGTYVTQPGTGGGFFPTFGGSFGGSFGGGGSGGGSGYGVHKKKKRHHPQLRYPN